jgi:hypothetical protein
MNQCSLVMQGLTKEVLSSAIAEVRPQSVGEE